MEDDKQTLSGRDPELRGDSAPAPIDPATGQHKDHWVLPQSERAKGFIRPVRESYKHEVCGQITSMPKPIAETYARKPTYYGSTFCAHCKDYFRVGEHGKFVWLDDGAKVGV